MLMAYDALEVVLLDLQNAAAAITSVKNLP